MDIGTVAKNNFYSLKKNKNKKWEPYQVIYFPVSKNSKFAKLPNESVFNLYGLFYFVMEKYNFSSMEDMVDEFGEFFFENEKNPFEKIKKDFMDDDIDGEVYCLVLHQIN